MKVEVETMIEVEQVLPLHPNRIPATEVRLLYPVDTQMIGQRHRNKDENRNPIADTTDSDG